MTRSVIRSKVVSKESVVVAGSLALRYVPQEIIGTQEFGVFEIYLITTVTFNLGLITQIPFNPGGLLRCRSDSQSRISKVSSRVACTVMVHFWPNLAFLANLGYDTSKQPQKASK